MTAARILAGVDHSILLLCDHASNTVPAGVTLGVSSDLLERHIAVDIGAGPLTEALAATLFAPAILASVSRLVIDLNRSVDQTGLVPVESDGHIIPGNVDADIAFRINAFHAPYHAAIEAAIDAHRPDLIVAVHSFTAALERGGSARPWQIGVLSNQDRRAADIALTLFAQAGIIVGDNEPYSGQLLNATLNHHAEARGIPSISLEVRNDLIENAEGVARWSSIITPILHAIRNRLASNLGSAT
jgi:predicted N-formylglutamate amidohydrolase